MSYLQCFIKDLPCCSAWHSASGEEGIPTNALVTTWQLAMPEILESRSQVHRPSRSTPWRKVETWQGIFQSRPLDNAISLRWRLQLGPHPGGSAGKKEPSDSISDPPGSLPTPTPTITTTPNQPLLSLEHCAQSALSSCLPNLPLTHQMCGRQP